MTLLTKRERKIAHCIGYNLALKDEYGSSEELDEKVEQAVDAIIQAFDEENVAEQLSNWEEDFHG